MSSVQTLKPGEAGYADARAAIQSAPRPRVRQDWNGITKNYNALEVGGFIRFNSDAIIRTSNLAKVMAKRGLTRGEDFEITRVKEDAHGGSVYIQKLSASQL